MCVLFKILIKPVGQLNEFLRNTVMKFELLSKEELQMVDMYVALVMNQRRQIAAGGPLPMVPEKYSDAVMKDLTALGLDGYGYPLPTEQPTE